MIRHQAILVPRAQIGEVRGKEGVIGDFEALSRREGDVLSLLVDGKTNKEIAQVLSISSDTAKKHVQSIIAKLGAVDRTQAAVKALRFGLMM